MIERYSQFLAGAYVAKGLREGSQEAQRQSLVPFCCAVLSKWTFLHVLSLKGLMKTENEPCDQWPCFLSVEFLGKEKGFNVGSDRALVLSHFLSCDGPWCFGGRDSADHLLKAPDSPETMRTKARAHTFACDIQLPGMRPT